MNIKTLKRSLLAILLTLVLAAAAWLYLDASSTIAPRVTFDLGQNIEKTIKQSGLPIRRMHKMNVAGYISYDAMDLSPKVVFQYTRPGYEISWDGLFSFGLSTNEKLSPDLQVHKVNLHHRGKFASHQEAKAFIEQTIQQFQQGKWKRYFYENGPRITGRSSFLDLNGELSSRVIFSPDPDYRIPDDEWLDFISRRTILWEWTGDGVHAELSVSLPTSSAQDEFPLYSIWLTLQNEEIQNHYTQTKLKHDLEEGDAKGWSSTEKHKQGIIKAKEKTRLLEQAALNRGDSIVPRDDPGN